MAEEKIFADGFSFKRNENAPDFVVGRVSIKTEDAIAFMRKHDKGGWVNLDVKQASHVPSIRICVCSLMVQS